MPFCTGRGVADVARQGEHPEPIRMLGIEFRFVQGRRTVPPPLPRTQHKNMACELLAAH